MNVKEVIDQIGSDVLTEETKKLLTEAFNEAVEKRAKEVTELESKNVLQQLDEDHAKQLETLLEAIDKDHTDKLTAVLSKIDEDHTEKLQYLVKKNNKLLAEDAAAFKAQLVKQLSNYIDLYLEDAIPKDELIEAVSNKQAQKTLNEIKQLVAIDEEYIHETIREAVADGKSQIDNLKKELNEAIKQNIRINEDFKSTKSDLLIEKFTQGFSKDKKDYCMRVLKDKDPDYLVENFKYVVKMFEKEENNNQEVLAESAKLKSRVISQKVDTPKASKEGIITESTEVDNTPVNEYLGALQHQDGK